MLVGARGATSNDKNRAPRGAQPAVDAQFQGLYDEPVDHAIGRSRGGLSSKIHALVDHDGRPLVVLVGAGQANDSPVFPQLMARLRVARPGRGRPRTRPTAVLADKAYSSRGHRAALRARGIATVIPEPIDQIRNRKRRGTAGGRPPAFDKVLYRNRNVVERNFNTMKQWRGLATRYDKLAIVYRGGAVLRAITIWTRAFEDMP